MAPRLRATAFLFRGRAAHPHEEPARTLRWMQRPDSLPYNCDGLFVLAAWLPALLACEVLEHETWCALSDHNPVTATFASPTGWGDLRGQCERALRFQRLGSTPPAAASSRW